MNFVRAIVFYIFYLPLINCANTNNPSEARSNLSRDGLCEVAKYLDRPFDFLGTLNKRIRNTYVDGRISRSILSADLGIPMITLMDENEDDINELLGMSIFKGQPKKFFLILYNAVFNRNLCPKLQVYLLKIMRKIYNSIELKMSERLAIDFNSKYGELLVKRGEISQVIEWFKDDPNIYYSIIFNLSFDNKKIIYSELIENENLRDILKGGLLSDHNSQQYLHLLSDAIVYDFPITLYSEYLIGIELKTIESLLRHSNFNLSEAESVALYVKLKGIIEENKGQSLNLYYKCNLLNELRFGPVDDIDVSHLDSFLFVYNIFLYLKMAYIAKKPSSLRTIVLHFRDYFDEHFFDHHFFNQRFYSDEIRNNIFWKNDMNVAKIYLDILEVLEKSGKMIHNFDSPIFTLMKRNSFVEDLNELGNVKDHIIIKFKSSLEMISDGFPDFIELIIDISEYSCRSFIYHFWVDIKTENSGKLRNLISNFFAIDRIKKFVTGMNAKKYALKYFRNNNSEELSDMMNYKDFKEGFEYGSDNFIIEASYETVAMISEDEHIKTILRNYHVKLFISRLSIRKSIENLINLNFGNIEINWIDLFYLLKFAKNDLEISRIEILFKRTVPVILLTKIFRTSREYFEELYYEYKRAFIYWLKGPHKQRISELPKIFKDLLEFEYPELMKEIN